MNSKDIENIFKYQLKKDARTVSVATLLSSRYLKRIIYNPYYQRNYVWEKDKQSFFIESIFLGTEIPPIVFFKKGTLIEVIDGRQRFETLKRFREDNFALHPSGLMDLKALGGERFSTLKPDFQQLFDDTKIRIFEFEIVGLPDVPTNVEDKVKKEIFRRYNSGITPLTQSEVDNAKYDKDDFTDYFKKRLQEDNTFNLIKNCFFQNSNKQRKDLVIEMASMLRKLLILSDMPISRYANTGKGLLIEMLYDNFIQTCREDSIDIKIIEERLLTDIVLIYNILPNACSNFYECFIWVMSVMRKEKISFDLATHKSEIINHYISNKDIYQTESDHYYGNVMQRFTSMAKLMKELYGLNYELYLRNSFFSQKHQKMQQTEEQAELSMEKLSQLRISKPNPVSKPIDQILREVMGLKYLIRPSYQRQEKINVTKASSIIESILLGIKLPPLFIYVRQDGVKEVVDGQQRLLTILGFLGEKYKNEDGNMVCSNNNNFVLKGLRILTDYNGKNFHDIMSKEEDTILDFDIDEIEIQEELNPNFEPTDLFIRLNNKPYPIKLNSFEMWNSTCDRDVIKKIKDITRKYSTWFYSVKPKFDENGESLDRMQNEELITILSFLCYNAIKTQDFKKVLGFYPRLEKFTCRIKTKYAITKVLDSLEDKDIEKQMFLSAIDKTDSIICIIQDVLLGGNPTKDSFNEMLNKKQITTFSRSNQEFYILWEILMNVSYSDATQMKDMLMSDIDSMLRLLKNIDDKEVNDDYVNEFMKSLSDIQNKYKS